MRLMLIPFLLMSNIHSTENLQLEGILLNPGKTQADHNIIVKNQKILIDWIVSHKNPEVRAAAIFYAGEDKFPHSTPNLIKALSDPDMTVSEAAGEALSHIDETDSIAALIEAAKRDLHGHNPWKFYNSLIWKMKPENPLRETAIRELRMNLPKVKGKKRFMLITTLGSLGDKQIKDILLKYDIKRELKLDEENTFYMQEYYLTPAIQKFRYYEQNHQLK